MTMTSNGPEPLLSIQERKDLEKYTRHLTYKVVQVVVQSRLGEKTKSCPKPERSDWFNLAIDDVKEVNVEASKAFNSELPCLDGNYVNIEVSVRTVDGDRMVLEVWTLNLNELLKDLNVHVTHTVYNRMGLLLKSLISVSRITPAYRFSREQGPECFVICYRVYAGESQLHFLGEDYEKIKIGEVGTPLGTLMLNVLYRTKLTITPHKIKKNGSFMMVNSDYFIPDVVNGSNHDGQVVSNGCHEDVEKMKSKQTKTTNSSTSSIETLDKDNGVTDHSFGSVDQDEIFEQNKKIGAFASPPESDKVFEKCDIKVNDIPEAPFTSLFSSNFKQLVENELNCDKINNKSLLCSNGDINLSQHLSQNNKNSDSKEKLKNIRKNLKNGILNCNDKSTFNEEDDFVLVELKTPFAGHHIKNELAEFFHDCRAAPTLQSFVHDQPTVEQQFLELNEQFVEFELDMKDYDNFVQSLCTDEGFD